VPARRFFRSPARSCALVALLVGAPVAAHAQSSSIGGVVAVSNQLVDRGLPVTPRTPVLQGALSWSTPTGWSAGLSASTETRSPGQIVEALAQGGYAWALSADWQMQTSLLYYRYSNDSHWRAYDRVELGNSLIYRDVLTIGVSAAELVRGERGRGPRLAADIDLRWPLLPHLSLSAGAGIAQYLITPYAPRHTHYQYGHAGLVWDNGPWRVELSHVMTQDAPRPRGSPPLSPWIATLSRAF
jgi:uncharacterized protein (TIGR02001 family)